MLVGSISANRDVLWQPLTYIFIYSSVNRSMILGRGSTLADLTDPFQMWPCLIILGVVRPIAWACGRPPLPFHHISGECLVSMEAFSYARPLTSGLCNLDFLYAYSILKSKSPFLRQFDAVFLLCPSSSEDWKDCFKNFQVGRVPKKKKKKKKSFPWKSPSDPAKFLREEFESRSVLAHALSVQAMTEFTISHNKERKSRRSSRKCYVSYRHQMGWLWCLASYCQDAFTGLAKALLCFGEARRVCRKLVFASATVKHDPERLINSSIWSESLFPEAIIKEIERQCWESRKIPHVQMG